MNGYELAGREGAETFFPAAGRGTMKVRER
jgi:hypothetical protein